VIFEVVGRLSSWTKIYIKAYVEFQESSKRIMEKMEKNLNARRE